MFTPAQVAEMLRIGASTLRKYSVLYRDHLGPSAHRKQRTYTDADILILKRVCELRSNGVPLAEVSSQLMLVDSTEPAPPDTMALIPQVAAQFQDLYDQISKLAHAQAEEIAALRERIEQLENKRPWYDRLFRRK